MEGRQPIPDDRSARGGGAGSPKEPLHGGGRDSPPSAGNTGKMWAKHKGLSCKVLMRGTQLWTLDGLKAQARDLS